MSAHNVNTVEPRLSGPRLSGFLDYPDFFFGPNLVMIIAPAGFWPRGQNPRRHPRIPRVYTYKEFQNVRK